MNRASEFHFIKRNIESRLYPEQPVISMGASKILSLQNSCFGGGGGSDNRYGYDDNYDDDDDVNDEDDGEDSGGYGAFGDDTGVGGIVDKEDEKDESASQFSTLPSENILGGEREKLKVEEEEKENKEEEQMEEVDQKEEEVGEMEKREEEEQELSMK
ncbi:hypothetical protein PoB_001030800 [Plakobranchus ocellatus]|uniref:Uncharacterized protein n=1 Tax=Plakobranchus ocellatus TaxID=259542 RepID=A0AAV3YN85_9GAST|nr:hypothetical protein PoB_001030800 [Plakobranchus ocellatus]